MMKSMVFAILIAWIGCLRGFEARGGASGVGNAANFMTFEEYPPTFQLRVFYGAKDFFPIKATKITINSLKIGLQNE